MKGSRKKLGIVLMTALFVALSLASTVPGTLAAAQGLQACPADAFPIANSPNAELSISAAFDGTNFLVGLQGDQTSQHDITAQLVSQSGALVGPRISTGRTGGVPYVAFDGTNYLMVWSDDAIQPFRIYGQFVSPAGALVGAPFLISQGTDSEDPGSIAFDGTDFLVTYVMGATGGSGSGSTGSLAARFVTKAGAVGNEIVLTSNTKTGFLSGIAFNGTSLLVAWRRELTAAQNVVEARTVSRTGDLGGVVTVSSSVSPNATNASVASDGTNFLVVWDHDIGAISWETHGRVVTGAGGFLGPEFTVAGATGQHDPPLPFAAYGGGSYLVTWTDLTDRSNGDVRARFVSPSGTPTGSAFAITSCPGVQGISPAVFGGEKFLVTWVDGLNPTTFGGGDVLGTFVTPFPIALAITTSSPLSAGTIGVPYSLQLAATGGTGSLTWSVVSGSLPGGLSLSAAGLLSGTPAAAGSYTFSVQVSDSASTSAQALFALSITGCISPVITAQPQGTSIQTGQAATLSVTATGAFPLVYQWYQGVSGDTSNPVGSNAATFTTPSLSATTSYWVRVTNSCGHADSVTATVTVSGLPTVTTVLFVPIVLSSGGLNGAFFTSEIGLTNRGSTDASISYAYTAAFGGSSGTASDSLQAGRQKILSDAITFLRGLGIPLGDSGNRGGTLRITFTGLSSADAGAATVRTTTSVAEGRAGLAYAGLRSSRLLSAPVYLCGLRQNATDRSNVAVMYAGGPSDGDITLRLTVVSGDPGNPRTQALPDIPLSPGGFSQVSGILASNGLTLTNGYVKVERISGAAPFYAYGVVNDQANSDGSFVEPVVASPATAVTGATLPVVVETSTFSTEAVLTNLTSSVRIVRCTYVASALPGGSVSFDISLLPNEQQILPDFVQVLRDRGVVSGARGPTFAGALFATDATGDLRGIFIGARTSAAGGGGRYGLFYSAVANGAEATTAAWLYGLQQNADNRTNLALVNVGSADSSTDVFRIDLYDGATGQKTATVDNLSVPAKGFLQINTIFAQYAPGVTSGYALVTRTSGSNPFIAYAVVNDGGQPGQRSGDGAFVAASLPAEP